MKTSILLAVAVCCGLSFGAALAPAQVRASKVSADVEVREVRFSRVQAPRGGGNWLEAAVELRVRGMPGGGEAGRWAERVGVRLALGVERRDGGYRFFQSEAEVVALKAGTAVVRFYLPPEIVERERISGAPFAWMAEIAVAGEARPGGLVSSVLRDATALESFRNRVKAEAAANAGVLVPQYDSPFEHEYAADTPSYVRRTGS